MVTLPIPLPTGFSLNVQVGDTVSTGDILAKKDLQKEISINISEILKIPIKKSARTLRRNPGDRVEKGSVLASKKTKFGMGEDVIVSQVEGTVLRYERDNGSIILVPHTDAEGIEDKGEEVLRSPIDGIVEVCDNDLPTGRQGQILLGTDKDIIAGMSGIGADFTGNVYNITQSQDDPEGKVQLHFLDSNVIGKIALGGAFDRDVLLKAIGMGVGGVIGYSIKEEDLAHVASRHLSTPVVTVDKEGYLRLLQWSNKKAYVQGDSKTILLLHL